MLPTALLAAAFAVPSDVNDPHARTLRALGLHVSVWSARSDGETTVPPKYAIEVWGNPPHLRNYPWNGGTPQRTVTLSPVKVPAIPPDPTAERIKAIENVILEIKAGGGSAAVIEQLQRDLDELKKKK